MKNQDVIDILLKRAASEQTRNEEPEKGHKLRFMQKLEQNSKKKKHRTYIRFISIAASVMVFIALGISFLKTESKEFDLADVSPEMEQTQYFFTTTIQQELKNIEKEVTPETRVVVDDALKQLEILENNYENLKKDLVKSGNDKRVIHAMISNFQHRVALLENVLHQLETINQKTNSYEII